MVFRKQSYTEPDVLNVLLASVKFCITVALHIVSNDVVILQMP